MDVGSPDGGGNDGGAAMVASALVVMTTFFRNVPGLVRDVTQCRHWCWVATVPHHNVEKTVFLRCSSSGSATVPSAVLSIKMAAVQLQRMQCLPRYVSRFSRAELLPDYLPLRYLSDTAN